MSFNKKISSTGSDNLLNKLVNTEKKHNVTLYRGEGIVELRAELKPKKSINKNNY